MVGGDGRRDLSKNSQLNFALNLKPGLEYAAVFWVQQHSVVQQGQLYSALWCCGAKPDSLR